MHFTTEKTVQNWELPTMHIYINLWIFVAFLVHFQTLFLMFFWICLEFSFRWGITRLYLKKLIIYPFFVQAPGVPVAHGPS